MKRFWGFRLYRDRGYWFFVYPNGDTISAQKLMLLLDYVIYGR